MGMAIPKPEEPRRPIYPGCVVCQNCGAEYRPGNWYRGFDRAEGTKPPLFAPNMRVPENCCPLCLEPKKIEQGGQGGTGKKRRPLT